MFSIYNSCHGNQDEQKCGHGSEIVYSGGVKVRPNFPACNTKRTISTILVKLAISDPTKTDYLW